MSASSRNWIGAIALFPFACAVYEGPGVALDSDDADGGTAGSVAGIATAHGAASGTADSEADAGGAGASGADGAGTGGVGRGGVGTGGVGTGGAGTGGAGGAGAGGAGAGGASGAGSSAGKPTGSGGDAPTAGGGGAPTVEDQCPNDPSKLTPGDCGCGVPDAPGSIHADCHTLKAALAHRYDFEGAGTAVTDRIGTAHGVARGSTLSKLDGKGVVVFDGGNAGAYVALPNGILSSLKNATIESWITWGGGGAWQRVFDFGDSTVAMPANNQGSGKTYLFLTPQSSYGTTLLSYSLASVAKELDVKAPAALGQSLSQIVAVADDTGNVLTLYVNGVKAAEQPWDGALSQINDVNAWLGRSQFGGDAGLKAIFHEFRIYNVALTAPQIASTFAAGPDPKFLAY